MAIVLLNIGIIKTAQRKEVTSEIGHLPIELLCRILSCADRQTINNALCVSHEFHKAAALCLPSYLWEKEGLPVFPVLRNDIYIFISHPEDVQQAIFDRPFWDLANENNFDVQQLPNKTPFFRALFASPIPDDVFNELCGDIPGKYAELLEKFGYTLDSKVTEFFTVNDMIECDPMNIITIKNTKDNTKEAYSLINFDCNMLKPVKGARVLDFNENASDGFMKLFVATIPSNKLWHIRVKNHSVRRGLYIELSRNDIQVAVFEKFFQKRHLPDGLCLVIDTVSIPNIPIIDLVVRKKLVCESIAPWINPDPSRSQGVLLSIISRRKPLKKVTPVLWKHKDDLRTLFYETLEEYSNDSYAYQPSSLSLPRNIPYKNIVETMCRWHPDLQKIKQIFCKEPFLQYKNDINKILRSFIDDSTIAKVDTIAKILLFSENHPDIEDNMVENVWKKYSEIIFDKEADRCFWKVYEENKARHITLFGKRR